MELKDLQNAGSEILDAVSNAVASGNFDHLSDSIRRSVTTMTKPSGTLSPGMRDALNRGSGRAEQNMSGVSDTVRSYGEQMKGKSAAFVRPDSLRTYSSVSPDGVTIQKGGKVIRSDSSGVTISKTGSEQSLPDTPYFRQGYRALSPYTGVAKLALGALGAVACGGLAIGLLVPGLIFSWLRTGAFVGAGLFLAGFGACVYTAVRGSKQRRRYERYREYGRVIADADYIAIADLAAYTGIDGQTILSDIKTLQKDGVLPDTYLDANNTTLMVTRKAYEQYLAAEKARLRREQEERALSESLSGSVFAVQVQQILSDGDQYLKEVRELNRRIPDAEMTAKIDRIENLMHKTFEEVRQKPEAAPSLRKYMSYYLPTTVKLLTAYADLDKKPDIGENIANTKREISDSLDTVGDGFEKLFDSLFEEMSWDISSDISVMKTMMAQDGLMEDTLTADRQTAGS